MAPDPPLCPDLPALERSLRIRNNSKSTVLNLRLSWRAVCRASVAYPPRAYISPPRASRASARMRSSPVKVLAADACAERLLWVESGHCRVTPPSMIRSADEFQRLRTSSKPEEYGRAATEAADEAVWLDVLEKYPDMRFWVAQNKTVPLGVLRLLASDEDPRVRSMVAMKRTLDPEAFALLVRDEDVRVRHRVACNPKAPTEVLHQLSKDVDRYVAAAATERLEANVG
jgi:hypothetical protein